MAASGLWVKVGATLPRHYKTEKLAEMLSLPVHEVVGKLVCLWIYTVEFCNEGVLTREDVRRGFFAPDETQDTKAINFVISALRDCGLPMHGGFLDEVLDENDGTCRYIIHDWTDYSGTYRPDEKPKRSLSYKKRGDTKEEKKERTDGRADNAAHGSASADNAQTPEKRSLPRVKQPLVNNEGHNFKSLAEIFARYVPQDGGSPSV